MFFKQSRGSCNF